MIKTKVIKTPKGRLLVVGGLPENIKHLTFILDALFWAKTDGEWKEWNAVVIDQKGNWQLLGKLPDITEEQAQKVVLEYPDTAIVKGPLYLHFTGNDSIWDLDTAKESLISLIESEVSLKNKLGEYPTEESTGLKYGMEYLSKVDNWEEEQEKVFTDPVLFWENKNEQQ